MSWATCLCQIESLQKAEWALYRHVGRKACLVQSLRRLVLRLGPSTGCFEQNSHLFNSQLKCLCSERGLANQRNLVTHPVQSYLLWWSTSREVDPTQLLDPSVFPKWEATTAFSSKGLKGVTASYQSQVAHCLASSHNSGNTSGRRVGGENKDTANSPVCIYLSWSIVLVRNANSLCIHMDVWWYVYTFIYMNTKSDPGSLSIDLTNMNGHALHVPPLTAAGSSCQRCNGFNPKPGRFYLLRRY